MQFFEYGATHNERALFGGNRCLTPWTIIPTDRGERQVHEVFGEEGFGVQAWDGATLRNSQSTGVFLKGIEPAFRVHLDNGEVFECSDRHRVLTDAGYTSLGQIKSRADVLRWSHTPLGLTASCVLDGRPYDRLLLKAEGSVQEQLRTLSYAPSIGLNYSLAGAAASRFAHSHVCRMFDRRAIQDVPPRLSGLGDISEWVAPALPPSALPTFPADLSGRISLADNDRRAAEWQFSVLQLLLPQPKTGDVWLPCHTPVTLLGGNRILAIEDLGTQPIVDFEVPGPHNYLAAGVIHHNSGKTVAGCYEDTLHLTGNYPDWWPGKRFDHPVNGWVAGDTAKNVRDILQTQLCGKWGDRTMLGTGMIPGDLILDTTVKHGLSDAFEAIFVKHVPSGGTSMLQFKSYDQGRTAFQGVTCDFIHLDEEPPLDVYTESLLRTMTSDGIILLTATPLSGLTDLLVQFLPELAPEPEKGGDGIT